jgi:hypothetical protein
MEYADWLKIITEPEPLPWADYFIGRAKAIVRHRSVPNDPLNKEEIIRLENLADDVGFSLSNYS